MPGGLVPQVYLLIFFKGACAHCVKRVDIAHHSGKSATIRESNHGLGVCKEHYA